MLLAGDWKETKELGLSQHKRRETLVVKNRNCGAIPAVFLSNPQDPCMVYLPTNLPQKNPTIHLIVNIHDLSWVSYSTSFLSRQCSNAQKVAEFLASHDNMTEAADPKGLGNL